MSIPTEYFIFKIQILKKLIVVTSVVSAVSFLLGGKEFSFGFLVGGLLAMALFSLLYRYVLSLREIEPRKRKRFLTVRGLLIFLIMGLALAIGIKKGLAVFIGTALGIFSLKLVIFVQVFQEKYGSA